jgi:hypothetical protein
MIFKRILLCFACFGILLGCATRNQISNLEAEAGDYFSTNEMEELLSRGLLVARSYLALSDRAYTTQDVAFLGLLGLAAGSAINVADGGPTNDFVYAGIAGLAINQTANYFDPEETGNALLDASERQFCIVREALASGSEGGTAINIVREAFLRNKFRLRRDLDRELPSYQDILNDLKADLRGEANPFAGSNGSLAENVNRCFG